MTGEGERMRFPIFCYCVFSVRGIAVRRVVTSHDAQGSSHVFSFGILHPGIRAGDCFLCCVVWYVWWRAFLTVGQLFLGIWGVLSSTICR